jgi:putative ABC transport system ATP-binding protein
LDRAAVGALLDSLGLAAVRNSLPIRLSGGETARVGLAAALVGGAEVLLADEPTAEVSAAEEAAVLRLIRQHRPAGGTAVLVTHSVAVAAAADRVVHLRDGRLVGPLPAEGAPPPAARRPAVPGAREEQAWTP